MAGNESSAFLVKIGAKRAAKRVTLDDWEELIRAFCETVIDFTVFSSRLCCLGPSGSCLISTNKQG